MGKIDKKIKQIKVETEKDYKRFYNKHLKSLKDPIIIILKSHLFIENILDQLIIALVPKPKKLLDRKFSDKIDIFEALNMSMNPNITEKLRTLNKIRNKLSHDLNYRLLKKDLEPLNKGLKIRKNSRILIILRYSLAYLTGYLTAIKCTNLIIPFLTICTSYKNIFDKDPGFDFSSIKKNQYPNKLIKSIFDELSYQEHKTKDKD